MFRALIVSATTASVKRAMYTVKDTGMVGVDTVRYGAMCSVHCQGYGHGGGG